jgi:sulfur carrier protein
MNTINVNGKKHPLTGRITLAELLDELGVNRLHIAVEHNEIIIPRENLAERYIRAGDTVEIIQFVGGG